MVVSSATKLNAANEIAAVKKSDGALREATVSATTDN
jgi:hypothetical protein